MRGALGNDVLFGPTRREARVEGKPASHALTKRHGPRGTTASSWKSVQRTRIGWNEITHAILKVST